jgi:hypothetical protein
MRSSLYEQLERDRLEPRAARLVLERREREFAELRSALVSFQVDLAIVKLKRFLARKYRADQPRVPAGSPDGGGGRWGRAGPADGLGWVTRRLSGWRPKSPGLRSTA